MGGTVRGYFGIGVEAICKPMNLGSLLRTAHAFEASFVFTVNAGFDARAVGHSDTSDTAGHVPLYTYPDLAAFALPKGCELVGVELLDDALELPSFRHPRRAAYVFGPERGALSPAMAARCDYLVKIPTKFCVNVGVAGALIMYDRMLSLGRLAQRPLIPGGAGESLPPHVFGEPVRRRKNDLVESADTSGGGE